MVTPGIAAGGGYPPASPNKRGIATPAAVVTVRSITNTSLADNEHATAHEIQRPGERRHKHYGRCAPRLRSIVLHLSHVLSAGVLGRTIFTRSDFEHAH